MAECSICIYEKLSHAYVFNYVTEFQATEGLASDYTSGDFRAHGLLIILCIMPMLFLSLWLIFYVPSIL